MLGRSAYFKLPLFLLGPKRNPVFNDLNSQNGRFSDCTLANKQMHHVPSKIFRTVPCQILNSQILCLHSVAVIITAFILAKSKAKRCTVDRDSVSIVNAEIWQTFYRQLESMCGKFKWANHSLANSNSAIWFCHQEVDGKARFCPDFIVWSWVPVHATNSIQ